MRKKEFAFSGEVESSEESIVSISPFYTSVDRQTSAEVRHETMVAITNGIYSWINPKPKEVVDRIKEYWPNLSASNIEDSLQAIGELIRCGFLITQEEFERLSSQPDTERAARRNKVLAILVKFYLNAELPRLLESRWIASDLKDSYQKYGWGLCTYFSKYIEEKLYA